MQRQSGFTLIELIVVIVILGILAAFAVPRFVGIEGEARTSTVKGAEGAIRGAASLAHGKQLAKQKGEDEDINADGKTITMKSGWPEANKAGIVAMLQDTSGFVVNGTTTACFTSGVDCTASDSATTLIPEGIDDHGTTNCKVSYSNNGTYAVNATTDGC